MSFNDVELPNDVVNYIFVLCGDVTRAGVCSVSSVWYQVVIAASRSLSKIPKLYDYTKPLIENINERAALLILEDYHLTVRMGNISLIYPMQACIAGNLAVCKTYKQYGIYTQYLMLSNNPEVQKLPSAGDLPDHLHKTYMYYLYEIKRIDLIKMYENMYPRGNHNVEYEYMNKVAEIIYNHTVNNVDRETVELIQYFIYDDLKPYPYHIMFRFITEHDRMDLLDIMFQSPKKAIDGICSGGSVRMLKYVLERHPGIVANSYLLNTAFFCNNLPLFKYIGDMDDVSVNEMDVYEGISHGCKDCVAYLLQQEKNINIHRVVNDIAEYGAMKISDIVDHISIPQEEFNYGLKTALYWGTTHEEFLKYADNYDKELYDSLGIVVVDS